MYIVQWRDHEGNPQERGVQRLREAEAEAYSLSAEYDGVRVVPDTLAEEVK